jgi:hypothetical protein
MHWTVILWGLSMLVATAPGWAQPTTYTNESTFLQAVSGLTLESFEHQSPTPQNTAPIVTDAFTMTIATTSAGTLNWRILDSDRPTAGTYATDGTTYVEAGSQAGNVPFVITFAFHEQITAFGLHIVDFGDLASAGKLILRTNVGDRFVLATAPGRANGNVLFFALENASQPFSTVFLEKTTTTDGIALDAIYARPALREPPEIVSITAPSEPVDITKQPLAVSATFSDADDDDDHTAVWDWGDSTTTNGTVDQTANVVSGSHVYTEPGVYPVTLRVTDSDATSDEAVHEFVVVYDPSGGFVTGGGWMNSPAGAYMYDPAVTGKATFSFVSKYNKAATVPTGYTEFTLSAGGLHFHSSLYDWLVVTGSDSARFKGTGTLNGLGDYKFKVWAGDGEPDTFRIRIWWEDADGTEHDVYDNGFDQSLWEGSIKIHHNK